MKDEIKRKLRKIRRQVQREAWRQIRSFPKEFGGQLVGGWGDEFAEQLFGTSRRRRSGR